MRLALVLIGCLAGCDSIFDLERVTLRGDGGGGSDDNAGGDASDAALPCYGATAGGFLSVCLQPGADDDWVGMADIDTDSAVCEQVQPQASGSDLCVIAGVAARHSRWPKAPPGTARRPGAGAVVVVAVTA